MATRIHFTGDHSLTVEETYGEVRKSLLADPYVELTKQSGGKVTINSATVTYYEDAPSGRAAFA